MKWHELLYKVSTEPFFKSGFLMAGENRAQVGLQLSRWVKSGKLIQLRKGLYTLAAPYSKSTPHPFTLANALKPASYVSLQSALAYHSLIPEHVPVITSVTTQRPETIHTELAVFEFRHIKKSLFDGFRQIELVANQYAFIARPEKSLIDLIYLTPGAETYDFLKELRLQNVITLRFDLFNEYVNRSNSPKLRCAAKNIAKLINEEQNDVEI